MKEMVIWVLLVMLIIPVSVSANGQSEAEQAGETVLTIPHYKSGQNVGGKFFLPQVERFNEQYDGLYEIVIEEIPQDSYHAKIKQLAMQMKLPPLVEGADKQWFKEIVVKNNLFYDMTDWLDSREDLKKIAIKESLDFVTTDDGKIASLPKAVVRPIGMYYNSTMVDFEKPVNDMTIDEFRNYLGDQKMAFMTAENAWTTSLFLTAIVVEEGGVDMIKAGVDTPVTDYTSDLWVKSFERLQAFLQENASANTLGAAYADAANSFMSKSSAVIPNGPWMVGDFDESASDKWSNGFSGDQVKGIMYPGNVAVANLAGYHWWIPSTATDKEREAALAFLEFIYSREELEAFILAEGGTAPNLTVSEDFRGKLAQNRLLNELDQAVNGETLFVPRATDVMPPYISDVEFGKMLPKLIDGSMTPYQFGEELSWKAQDSL